MTEIVAVDIGGTHARFALAEVEGGRVVAPRRGLHAEDGRACQPADRLGGVRRPARPPAARRPPASPSPARSQGDVLKLTNNPLGHPPRLIPRSSASSATRWSTISAPSPMPSPSSADEHFAPSLRAGAAAARRGRDQHRRPRHRPRRRPVAPPRRPLSRHRDRGRPYRLRAARQPRGPDPRPAAAAPPPGLGRAGRLRPGPRQPLRGARRDRGPRPSPAATTRRSGRRPWPARTASPPPPSTASAWRSARSPATSRWRRAPRRW